jgi:hypothetical protein
MLGVFRELMSYVPTTLPSLALSRCRMHGGLSTGPRTEEGRRRSLEALERGRRTLKERGRRSRLAENYRNESISYCARQSLVKGEVM